MMSEAEQKTIEDSLRRIQRYPIPNSVIDRRTSFVASIWGTLGIARLAALSAGVGISPIPEITIFY